VSFDVRGIALDRLLNFRALTSVAKLAAQLDVAGSARAASGHGHDVVELEPLAAPAVDTATLVTTPDLTADVLGERPPSGARLAFLLSGEPSGLALTLRFFGLPIGLIDAAAGLFWAVLEAPAEI
jgi:hypothetical protein